jgi:hypothetical protein
MNHTQLVTPIASPLNFLTACLKDAGNLNQISPKDVRADIEYVKRRIQSEGVSFCTKILPKFGAAIFRGIELGSFSIFPYFKKRKNRVLPCFLHGFTERIFADDGSLLDNPDVDCLSALRQITYGLYKVEGDYPKELVNGYIHDFRCTDASLCHCDTISPATAGVIDIAADILAYVLKDLDLGDLSPRPGPGQTSCKTRMRNRFQPNVHYAHLHERFPYYKYFYCSTDHLLDRVKCYRALKREESGTSKLTTVPKDSRGPRIICMEPHEYMWIQQGIKDLLVERLESHPLTRGHVNFTDQTINGELALKASCSGDHSTLDMKEASDRISRSLVDLLFDQLPTLKSALFAASTGKALMPEGDILHMKKFAPMGSALCFPVMSAVHFALAVASVKVHTGGSIRAIAKNIYVYGDDLVVRTDYVPYLFEEFPVYGLVFNQDKSFYRGRFRESCGVDAYNGINITPIKVKSLRILPRNAASIKRAFDVYHDFLNRGYIEIAKLYGSAIRTLGVFPYVRENSPALGWISPHSRMYLNGSLRRKWDKDLQTYRVLVRIICARPSDRMKGDWERFLRANLAVQQGDTLRIVERDQTRIVWAWLPLSSL